MIRRTYSTITARPMMIIGPDQVYRKSTAPLRYSTINRRTLDPLVDNAGMMKRSSPMARLCPTMARSYSSSEQARQQAEEAFDASLPSYVHDKRALLYKALSENELKLILQRIDALRHLYDKGDKQLIDLRLVCIPLKYSDRDVSIVNVDTLYEELFGVAPSVPGQDGNYKRLMLLWKHWSAGEELHDDKIVLVGSPDITENIIDKNTYWSDVVYKTEVVPKFSRGQYYEALLRVLKFLEEDFRMKKSWLDRHERKI